MFEFGNKVLIFDGAMGTILQQNGLHLGELPEVLNIKNPELICNIHKRYIESGADIITTNTFGANEYKLKSSGFTVEEIINKAVINAKNAVENADVKIALDIGPIGELIEPLGLLKFDDAYNAFKRQIEIGVKSGVDIILIETMTDLYELKAAILAAKENSNLPIIVSMSFDESGRTFTGCLVESMAVVAEGLGVSAVGVNCSLGPVELKPIVSKLLENTSLPVIVQPNAGLPVMVDNETKYNISCEEFAKCIFEFADNGVAIVGGCCGTSPEYIEKISKKLKGKKVVKRNISMKHRICTPTRVVEIDNIRIIGERINPTGKKLLKEALLNNDVEYILDQAISQEKAGADILDVNTGLPGIDEAKVMVNLIKEIQAISNIPLQIDSSKKEAIEKGLRYYNGKPIVNSVNGEDAVLDSILPIVKKYGAAVIGLTMSDKGIPKKASERVEIARHIIKKAESYGIKKEDIYIDCLTLTASAQQEDVLETLKALKEVKEKFNVKTVLGVSNISFGLPKRELINETFLAMALTYGLDMPIINPNSQRMMDIISAYKVLANIDENSYQYIKKHSENLTDSNTNEKKSDLKQMIVEGLKDSAKELTVKMIKEIAPFEIIDNYLIPALDTVGEKYEKGIIFLPQLIQSAEAVKACIEIIKDGIKSDMQISKGKLIIATVKGDVHDIGKNIVKIILENYGYEIIDLGRDVSKEIILKEIKKNNIKLVGLSALMTTTVISMEDTIKFLKNELSDITIMVGGAVLTEDYAKSIGADHYAKDAKAAIEITKRFFG